MRTRLIRIPTKLDIEREAMVRVFNEKHGLVKREPRPCTCATDHGTHP